MNIGRRVKLLVWIPAVVITWAVMAGETEGKKEEKIHHKLKWSTASEENNFGYDIYRGDSEEGPFVKITETPLSGAGTTDNTSHYEFIDDTIEAGKVYFYYVESISLDGIRERFTPIFKSKPKGVRTE